MSERRRGILSIISGFSGAGKGTVTRQLISTYPERYRLSVSATTRNKREGEIHGTHYFFITDEEFEVMITDGAFLEHAGYVGHFYGTPRHFVEEMLEAGYDVILEIEQQGAFQVKREMPEALLIFLTPPSIEELVRRLTGRGTESAEEIEGRLAQAAVEAEVMDRFDYLVINDKVDQCVEDLHRLIQTEGSRMIFQENMITQLQEQLEPYRKEA